MNDFRHLLSRLQERMPGRVRADVPLCTLTTWRIGGPAALLVEPETVEEVQFVYRVLSQAAVPVLAIGAGSNILFDDRGFRGAILRLGRPFEHVEVAQNGDVHAGAASWVPSFVRRVAAAGFSGCEHAIGIPGRVGGLLAMNGGTHQNGIADQLVDVGVVFSNGEFTRLSRDECAFSYRSSRFGGVSEIITDARFSYTPADPTCLRREMLATLRERRFKFPLKAASCGSVFQSCPELRESNRSPGKIIQETGLKGMQVGGALVSSVHANFIVNTGRATSAEVLTLIAEIRGAVLEQTGIELSCEVLYASPTGRVMPAHLAAGPRGEQEELRVAG